MKNLHHLHLFFLFSLTGNFVFAKSSNMVCVADAGPDQFITCSQNCAYLDGFNSTQGVDIVYTWSGPGITGDNVNDIFAEVCQVGIYTLTVENTTEGCIDTDEVLVFFDVTPPDVAVTSSGDLDCNNINVTLTGSVSSTGSIYSYGWFNASGVLISNSIFTNVSQPGSYTLVVTDELNGCSAVSSIDVVDNSIEPIINISITPFHPCQLNSLATLDASGSYSNGPLIFIWQDLSGTEVSSEAIFEVPDLDPYELVLIDGMNGCTATEIVSAGEDFEMIAEYAIVQTATCGNCDGSIDITPEIPGSYIYDWSDDTFDGQEDPDGLCEGIVYHVTITDAFDSCYTVIEIADFEISVDLEMTSTYPTCGENDGTATAAINFGSNNPTFLWSNGATTATVTGLALGGYSVTVVDAITGCSTHENVIVNEDPVCKVHISGFVYNDNTDQDCDDTSVDAGLYNIMVKLSNGDITFTDINGFYQFHVDPGNYQISINLNTPQFLPLCTDTITVDLPIYSSVSENNNFYLIKNIIQDLNIKIVKGPARPGFEQLVIICAMNFGDAPIDGTVVFDHDPLQELVNTSGPGVPMYDEAATTVEWDFVGLPPGAVWVYKAYLHLDSSVPLGTQLNYYFALEPILGDINPANNVIECMVEVTGSYDPNDKRAIPMGETSKGYIVREDSLINYTIRFQNTGTDTAFTVVIRDTLDVDLDINTIVPLPSCRPYSVDMISDRVLEFTFDNILMPDSTTNEPESNGFVMYDIELKSGLEYGTTIENMAGIYFDYNLPIITNTTLNTLSKRRETISGTLQTETGTAINDVVVDLIGGDTSTTLLTSEDYSFDYIPVESEYTILPSKNDGLRNGISSFDIVLISKHILDIEYLDSPYKMIAADINNSGEITTTDVLELRKVILFINNEFPGNESWRFVEAAYVFPNPENPFENTFPEEVFIPNFMEDHLSTDFIGVKIGDVNSSVIPNSMAGLQVRNEPAGDLTFKTDNHFLQAGEEYAIPFKVSNFKNIVSCQFTIEFDADQLEFQMVNNSELSGFGISNLGLTYLDDGIITFSWSGNKSNMDEGAILFDLQFMARRSVQLSYALQLNSVYTKREAYREINNVFEPLDIGLVFENTISEEAASKELILYSSQPNPFNEKTMLPFYLPENGTVVLLVYDLQGRLIKEVQQDFEQGKNQFSVEGTDFPTNGLYYYQIKTTTESALGRMLFQK